MNWVNCKFRVPDGNRSEEDDIRGRQLVGIVQRSIRGRSPGAEAKERKAKDINRFFGVFISMVTRWVEDWWIGGLLVGPCQLYRLTVHEAYRCTAYHATSVYMQGLHTHCLTVRLYVCDDGRWMLHSRTLISAVPAV